MNYFFARLKRLVTHVASPRGLLIVVTAVAAAVAFVVPWTVLRVFAVMVAITASTGLALLVSERLAGEHRPGRGGEGKTGRETADLEPLVDTGSDLALHTPGGYEPTADPLVSVVVAAWNEAPFIATAIDSVRRQTLGAFECIIVDNASTDDTLDVALEAIGDDPRFRLLGRPEPGGPSAVRNTGLAHVTTRYVTFLDGDDFLYPQSLQMRLEALSEYSDQPWVAGTFCQWAKVDEHAGIGPTPESRWRKERQTWLSSLRDAPFIVSAPLMRTAVARAVGGFPEVAHAEDALFWNRVLREGYVFEPVHRIGVAYRIKQRSRFRRSAIEAPEAIASALARNAEATHELSESAPFPFAAPSTAYEWELTRVQRLIAALASAVEAKDQADTAELVAGLDDALCEYHIWELPFDATIIESAARASRYLPEAEWRARRSLVAAEMRRLTEPQINRLVADIERRQQTLDQHMASIPDDADGLTIRLRERRKIAPALLDGSDSEVAGKVILMPTARYHVDETGPLSIELKRLGVDSVVMVGNRRWPLVAKAQAAYPTPVLEAVDAGAWLKQALAVVVMNDWGEEGHDYVEAANNLGVPTFAKVEGVQDFNDDDVHWERNAYQGARWILAQGDNDVRALPGKDTIVVSSQRLERIWLGPARQPGRELAVINLNFTYGVLEDARDLWLDTALEACKTAEVPYVISLHPAERDRFAGSHPVATAPMRHLLTEASALISRFSTVPFEAMARGVPFVYHNPHGERVPTFHNPNGAFEVTTSASELVHALGRTRAWQDDYRGRCAKFFLSQVDVAPSRPSAQRAAEAIDARLR